MVNLANNSLFKASETKFYLKIDRDVYKRQALFITVRPMWIL